VTEITSLSVRACSSFKRRWTSTVPEFSRAALEAFRWAEVQRLGHLSSNNSREIRPDKCVVEIRGLIPTAQVEVKFANGPQRVTVIGIDSAMHDEKGLLDVLLAPAIDDLLLAWSGRWNFLRAYSAKASLAVQKFLSFGRHRLMLKEEKPSATDASFALAALLGAMRRRATIQAVVVGVPIALIFATSAAIFAERAGPPEFVGALPERFDLLTVRYAPWWVWAWAFAGAWFCALYAAARIDVRLDGAGGEDLLQWERRWGRVPLASVLTGALATTVVAGITALWPVWIDAEGRLFGITQVGAPLLFRGNAVISHEPRNKQHLAEGPPSHPAQKARKHAPVPDRPH